MGETTFNMADWELLNLASAAYRQGTGLLHLKHRVPFGSKV